MKRFFFYCILILSICTNLHAQGDLDEQNKIFYRNEISGAFLLNSNGWGLNFRYAERINAANKVLYDIDFAVLKHPKEYKIPSQNNPYGSGYVLGKKFVPFVFRPAYGHQKEIFRKFDVGGISVRRFLSVGPSVALLKPIYYEVSYSENVTKIQRFDDAINEGGNILGRASFFKGFGQLDVIPGAFCKFGVCFEYSKSDKVLHAIEAGAFAEAFLKKLPILATPENDQFFLTLFVSYRFGKVLDPLAKKKKKKPQKEDFFY
jgi:hypothetical protein